MSASQSIQHTLAGSQNAGTPADHGFVLPAEWEKQRAIWLSWPVSTHIWPQHREEIALKFAEIAAAMSAFQPVCINANVAAHKEIEQTLNRGKADLSQISLHAHVTDDVWCRDHGALFIKNRNSGEVAATNWRFNAWGGKFSPYDKDDTVPTQMAATLGFRLFHDDTILEGGAIEANGEGVLITTDAVLLNTNRNAGMTRVDYEEKFKQFFGIQRTIWLRDGIENDDTDGHIDNITRFFQPNAVITAVDDSQPVLRENLNALKQAGLETLYLPMPDTVKHGADPLPASYANFVVLNDAVLVPVFSQAKKDDRALGILREAFPGRTVMGIDCRLLLLEGGALHCLSMHQPA